MHSIFGRGKKRARQALCNGQKTCFTRNFNLVVTMPNQLVIISLEKEKAREIGAQEFCFRGGEKNQSSGRARNRLGGM